MLLRAGRREAARRGPGVQITGPELEDLACQAAGDALLAITQKAGQFRGESRFTTWAYKFVVFGMRVDHACRTPRSAAAGPALAAGVLQGGKNPAAFRHSSQSGGVCAVSIVVSGNTRPCRKALVPP